MALTTTPLADGPPAGPLAVARPALFTYAASPSVAFTRAFSNPLLAAVGAAGRYGAAGIRNGGPMALLQQQQQRIRDREKVRPAATRLRWGKNAFVRALPMLPSSGPWAHCPWTVPPSKTVLPEDSVSGAAAEASGPGSLGGRPAAASRARAYPSCKEGGSRPLYGVREDVKVEVRSGLRRVSEGGDGDAAASTGLGAQKPYGIAASVWKNEALAKRLFGAGAFKRMAAPSLTTKTTTITTTTLQEDRGEGGDLAESMEVVLHASEASCVLGETLLPGLVKSEPETEVDNAVNNNSQLIPPLGDGFRAAAGSSSLISSPAAAVVEEGKTGRRKKLVGWSERLHRAMLTETKFVAFGKSGIHGWGIFARRAIPQGSVVIEFRGQSVRHSVADLRERQYRAAGTDCYLFHVNDDVVLDTTHMGNIARFTNHSCSPSMFIKVLEYNGAARLVFCARMDIKAGQELTFDYRFKEEEGEEKMACRCGAPNCRGTLN